MTRFAHYVAWGESDPADRLGTFALEDLRPDPRAMADVRATLMSAARASLSSTRTTPARERRAWSPRAHLPRSAIALLAAGLAALFIAGGALAASGPGAPLYGPRLWLEAIGLPAASAARVEA